MEFNYNVNAVQRAMLRLLMMQELEERADYGKLQHKVGDMPSDRYFVEEYRDSIDSKFYTDLATSTLGYTISMLHTNLGHSFSSMLLNKINSYFMNGSHDLINDSDEDFADFNGDDTILDIVFDDEYFNLYAYYNEFQLASDEERQRIFCNAFFETGDEIVVKKTEKINGVDIDFYYMDSNLYSVGNLLLQHEYDAEYLADKLPGNVLNAVTSRHENFYILTVDYWNNDYQSKDDFNGWGGYFFGDHIVVKDNNFSHAIVHEVGHAFDVVNELRIGNFIFNYDYTQHVEIGHWDILAEKYADQIFLTKNNFNIAGYSADAMREKHNEFYAECFKLYFSSPETRAALPEKVRNRIELEIQRYAK